MWGAGEVGQLGTFNRLDECKPTLIRKMTYEGESIKEMALGYFHSLILTDKGRVYQTGQANSKNIDTNFYTTFHEVMCLCKRKDIQKIKAKEYSVALTEEGQIIIWTNPYHCDTVGGRDGTRVQDFELSHEFMILRSIQNEFLSYVFKNKALRSVE